MAQTDEQSLLSLLNARQLGLKLMAVSRLLWRIALIAECNVRVHLGNVLWPHALYRSGRLDRSNRSGDARKGWPTHSTVTDTQAQELIHSRPEWAAQVVYGDTDSLFVALPGRSKDAAFKIGNEIADAVTAINPKPVKLKFEKVQTAQSTWLTRRSTWAQS